jgi:peptidoglycan/LPS O-acetylase OafA/YrhL
MSAALSQFISGIIMMGYLIAGLFFLRFWKETRDRLFALFGVAFFLLATQRLAFVVTSDTSERAIWWYALRLVAFIIILLAIVDKNRSRRKS